MTPEELFESHKHLAEITLNKMFFNVDDVASKNRVQKSDMKQWALIATWEACLNHDSSKSQLKSHIIRSIKFGVMNNLSKNRLIKSEGKQAKEARQATIASMDKVIGDNDDDFTLHDLIDSGYCLTTELSDKHGVEHIFKVLNGMDDKTQYIVKERIKGRTLRDIATDYNESKTNIEYFVKKFKKYYDKSIVSREVV